MKRLLLLTVSITAPWAAHAQNVNVLALTCTPTSGGPLIQGEVTNVSAAPLEHVVVIATFRNANGKFVSTQKVYADFVPILPGQTSTFKGYGGMNPAITNVTIAPALAFGPALVASGMSSAPCPAR
jgi:hypothetical protein